MRAADCFEKVCRVHPDWIESYVDRMLADLTGSEQPSIQWHLVQLLAQVNLTDDQEARAVTWLKGLLSTIEIDWIVSANAMKTLVQFYGAGLLSKHELVRLLEIQRGHKSATVQKKAAQFLLNL